VKKWTCLWLFTVYGCSGVHNKTSDANTPKASSEAPAAPQTCAELPECMKAFEEAEQAAQQDPEQGFMAYTQILQQHPLWIEAFYHAGVYALKTRRFSEADTFFTQAVDKKKEAVFGWIGLALLADATKPPEEAFKVWESLFEKFPQDLVVKTLWAQCLVKENKHEQAHALVMQVLTEQEKNAGAVFALGMMYRRQHKKELARYALNRTLELDPLMAEAHEELGLLWYEQKRFNEALPALQKAVSLAPHVPSYWNNVCIVLTAVGSYAQALESCSKAVEMEPNNPEFVLNQGVAFRGEQKMKEAAEAYAKAFALSPQLYDALYNEAVLHFDNTIDALTPIPRFQKVIDLLLQYKKNSVLSDEEKKTIDGYIAQAQRNIETEEKRLKRDRERKEKERLKAEAEARKKAEENVSQEQSEKPSSSVPEAVQGSEVKP
jgi:tetratricopeptide (TPR) repeat protein